MSVLYSFVQADNEQDAQGLIDFLAEEHLLPTPNFRPGRNPTYAELRQALNQAEGYKIEYRISQQSWDVMFETPDGIQAWLYGMGWDKRSTDDENVPANFYWNGGVEEMLPIARKLANVCGTITMVSGSDPDDFTFVFPDQSE